MSSLFKPKMKTTTSTTDPWETMPDWLKRAYETDAGRREDLLDQGEEMGPRDIEGINSTEQGAFDEFLRSMAQSNAMGDDAAAGLAGVDLEGILPEGGYEDQYVGDVVDTTLAGMQRQADRDSLARQSQGAAVGGTSNTRGAVADAVSGQLTNMNMGEMEAKLRSQGLQWGAGMEQDLAQLGLNKAGMDMERFGMMDNFANTSMDRSLAGYGIGQGFGEKERGLDQMEADADREQIGWLADLMAGTSSMKGPTGSTTIGQTPGNSPFQNILGAGASLAGGWLSMQSDERVKENVEDAGDALSKIGELGAREYEYKSGFGHTKARTTGLMAQDIERAGITGGVHEVDGVKHVDPYPILATVVQAVKELDQRTR